MLAKFLGFFSRPSTLTILASMIMILLILLGLKLWFLELNLLPDSLQQFSLRDWTVALVAKLQWFNDGGSTLQNSITLFFLLALATGIGLPRQIAAFVAGINLGAFLGVIIATLATTLGCYITYNLAHYFLNTTITQKYPKKVAALSDFLNEHTFLKAIALRILPLGSNFLANIIAGVSKVSTKAFMGGSFIGFIPQMIIFSLAGSGLSIGATNELIASIFLFIIALLIGVFLVKAHRIKSL